MDIRLKRFIAVVLDYMFVFFTYATIMMFLSLALPEEMFITFGAVLLILWVFVYFTIVPMFYNSMTIGLSIVKLKIIKSSGKEVSFFGLLFRNFSIVISAALAFIFATLLDMQALIGDTKVEDLSEKMKEAYDLAITKIQFGMIFGMLVLVFFGISVLIMGNRGLHDLIARTSVVEDDY